MHIPETKHEAESNIIKGRILIIGLVFVFGHSFGGSGHSMDENSSVKVTVLFLMQLFNADLEPVRRGRSNRDLVAGDPLSEWHGRKLAARWSFPLPREAHRRCRPESSELVE